MVSAISVYIFSLFSKILLLIIKYTCMLKHIFQLTIVGSLDFKHTYFILIFGSFHVVFRALTNLKCGGCVCHVIWIYIWFPLLQEQCSHQVVIIKSGKTWPLCAVVSQLCHAPPCFLGL